MPAAEHLVRVDGHRLRLTNLDKVLYPTVGTTKGEVIDYYTRVAPLLIPHVTGRPVTRKRWPEGVDHPPFFAKDLERGAPSWVPRSGIDHSSGMKEYPLVGDVATLVYLAQVASLELHVPQWRFDAAGAPRRPDRLVLDLDPGPGVGLAECAEVARWAKEILGGMGLEPYPVTSGSKGIHLYAALGGDLTSDEVSAIARELARALEADHPDLVVSQMAKVARPGKVFIDWSQNNGSKTTIAPYSLRGRDEPTVAAPRTWAELDDPALRHLLLEEVLERVAEIGDPMAALGFSAEGRPDAAGPLATYIAKRSPGRTPEPVPTNALAQTPGTTDVRPRFVIQEHHASRLHWDFRLERGGVFVSWAVPKGVPETPARNHLAVMTEDHPLAYGTFEGTIPRGEYGAGTVTIWDAGHYELEKWRDDEIILTAEGRDGGPLGRARLALIRTDGSGEKSTWLLHRMKADATITPVDASSQPVDTSLSAHVSSGPHEKSVDAGDAPDPEWPRGHVNRNSHSAHSDSTSTDGHVNRNSRSATREPAFGGTLPAEPMLATLSTPVLARAAARRWDDPWAELKWDGVRALGTWDGATLRLRARSGTDITARYPELTDAARTAFGTTPVSVDGEIVALDERGRPSFTLLQNRMHLTHPGDIARERQRTAASWFLFDVLSSDGADVTARPLADRRALLEQLPGAPVIVVPPILDDVDAALNTARELTLEGIVVKDPRSTYRPGRSEAWLKVKLTQTQEVVIGGIRVGEGTRPIKSLLLGVPTRDGLRYVGRVGSGFTEKALAHLGARLHPLLTDESPFVDVPAADATDAAWVRAELVAEVEYAEATPGGILRHARWRGLRSDKTPADVTIETPPTPAIE